MSVQVIGSGQALVGVPDVIGKTRAEAVAALAAFRVRVQLVEVAGETADTVYGQIPEAPRLLRRNSVVTIQVITDPAGATDDQLDAIEKAVGELKVAVDAVETDANANTRFDTLNGKLDEILGKIGGSGGTPSGGGTGTGTVKKTSA